MKKLAKAGIVATLGPSSSTYSVIRKMVEAGMDVARFNFSHGTHAEHLAKVEHIRKINKRYRRNIRLLQDLEGFRIRIGTFRGKKTKILNKKDIVYFSSSYDESGKNIIPFDYKGDLKKIPAGTIIYIDDGNIKIKVTSSTKKKLRCEVVEGGCLKERKGINMPGVKIPFSGVTPKDIKDMEFGVRHKVDYVAQSFVRTPKDIDEVRKRVISGNPGVKIIAKIESREAIKNIDEIIDISDGIMVARGDMGIAVPIYEIPVIQKTIIRKCNDKKKFVITATQMLEHMTEHSRPTRAEVTDVANAILDGTDYVMLSEESAAGEFPVESVKMMDKIIKFTEIYKGRKEKK